MSQVMMKRKKVALGALAGAAIAGGVVVSPLGVTNAHAAADYVDICGNPQNQGRMNMTSLNYQALHYAASDPVGNTCTYNYYYTVTIKYKSLQNGAYTYVEDTGGLGSGAFIQTPTPPPGHPGYAVVSSCHGYRTPLGSWAYAYMVADDYDPPGSRDCYDSGNW